MKNADGKKYDENCEKFELGSFSYRGPNSSETMTISVRNHLWIAGFFCNSIRKKIISITQKKSKKHTQVNRDKRD